MRNLIFIYLLLPLLWCACNDDEKKSATPALNYSAIKKALVEDDFGLLRQTINPYFAERQSEPSSTDKEGYKLHFESFVKELKLSDQFEINLAAYGIVKTNPPMSEINFHIQTENGSIDRTIDIQPDMDGIVKVVRMH